MLALSPAPPEVPGPDGIPPLVDMEFSALTQSPRLVSRGVEPIGTDEIETFERIP